MRKITLTFECNEIGSKIGFLEIGIDGTDYQIAQVIEGGMCANEKILTSVLWAVTSYFHNPDRSQTAREAFANLLLKTEK